MKFDVETVEGRIKFQMSVYSSDVSRYDNNSYILSCSGNTFYLQRYIRNAGSHSLGAVQVPGLNNLVRCQFELLIDKASKRFRLLINGKPVAEWVDSHNFVGTGTGVVFYARIAPLSFR